MVGIAQKGRVLRNEDAEDIGEPHGTRGEPTASLTSETLLWRAGQGTIWADALRSLSQFYQLGSHKPLGEPPNIDTRSLLYFCLASSLLEERNPGDTSQQPEVYLDWLALSQRTANDPWIYQVCPSLSLELENLPELDYQLYRNFFEFANLFGSVGQTDLHYREKRLQTGETIESGASALVTFEDLHLPFKPKRTRLVMGKVVSRSKATFISGLVDEILADRE